jgi:hypothetical protein
MSDVSVSTVIAPDAIGPIVGFRQWVVVGDEIYSPLARTGWGGEPMQAQCLARCRRAGGLWRRPSEHGGPAPDPECVCGIYALFEPETLRRRDRLSRVSGAVVVWGRLEVHETGMRAEFARIVALSLPGGRHRGADRVVGGLAERLGVQAVPARRIGAAALVHGDPVPPVLVPG